jgi:hypothetical protein
LRRVDDEVPTCSTGETRGCGPARERADAGGEDRKIERLAEVLIRAKTKAFDQVLGFRCGCEHEHLATASGGDELSAHLVAA